MHPDITLWLHAVDPACLHLWRTWTLTLTPPQLTVSSCQIGQLLTTAQYIPRVTTGCHGTRCRTIEIFSFFSNSLSIPPGCIGWLVEKWHQERIQSSGNVSGPDVLPRKGGGSPRCGYLRWQPWCGLYRVWFACIGTLPCEPRCSVAGSRLCVSAILWCYAVLPAPTRAHLPGGELLPRYP